MLLRSEPGTHDKRKTKSALAANSPRLGAFESAFD